MSAALTASIGKGLKMSYELSWHIPDKVLLLRLDGDYTVEDAKRVNESVTQILDHSSTSLMLLIDARTMNRSYAFQQIRSAQSFVDHIRLKQAAVVTNDQIVKLAMLVIFGWGRCNLTLFATIEHASAFFQRNFPA